MRIGRLTFAVLVAAAVVVSAPGIGEARAWLRREFPAQFLVIINAGLALSIVAAMAVALARIRAARAWRYGLIAIALGLAAAAAAATTSPSASQNAVERFHFIEYGLVTFLFYRVWRDAADLSVILLPILAGLLTSTADEWFQWFVPDRYGELRDIFINLWAILAGLLFSLGFALPERLTLTLPAVSRWRVGVLASVCVVALAAFIHTVHMGVVVVDPQIGAFRSRYTAGELLALADERTNRWGSSRPPMTLVRFSREDQYLAEGLWHIQARNEAWSRDVSIAWHENQILEKYFAPVLDTPSHATPVASRWPPVQRLDAAARSEAKPASEFVSHAERLPLFAGPVTGLWAAVVVLVGVCLKFTYTRRR